MNQAAQSPQLELEHLLTRLIAAVESQDDLRLLTQKEAAELLGWSEAQVSRVTGAGELKAFRRGKTVRIRRSDLREFIERNTA